MKSVRILFLNCFIASIFILAGCAPSPPNESPNKTSAKSTSVPKGKLFIIGGGKRPPELIQELVTISDIEDSGEVVILPMSSGEPDSSIFYATKQFTDLGIPENRIIGIHFTKDSIDTDRIEQLQHAELIYIPGGSQSRFMETTLHTPIQETIQEAYQNGATIAGTSAGAAVMSEKMITGDEYKHPEYTGNFRTIESHNIILEEGLGLLQNAIVDQHFIRRMRMNRLISVVIENPDQIAIGIDESTAIIVEQNHARVVGLSQVVVIRNSNKELREQNGLLGAYNLELSIKLPGESFTL